MDPNIALARLRSAAMLLGGRGHTQGFNQDDLDDALEAFEALDRWLSSGGFLPRAWQRESGRHGGSQ